MLSPTLTLVLLIIIFSAVWGIVFAFQIPITAEQSYIGGLLMALTVGGGIGIYVVKDFLSAGTKSKRVERMIGMVLAHHLNVHKEALDSNRIQFFGSVYYEGHNKFGIIIERGENSRYPFVPVAYYGDFDKLEIEGFESMASGLTLLDVFKKFGRIHPGAPVPNMKFEQMGFYPRGTPHTAVNIQTPSWDEFNKPKEKK